MKTRNKSLMLDERVLAILNYAVIHQNKQPKRVLGSLKRFYQGAKRQLLLSTYNAFMEGLNNVSK